MSELQDMLRVQARLHRKQGANALGQLFESAIEEIKLLKKTYNKLFDAFQDCQGELAKANERVRELEAPRKRNLELIRALFYAPSSPVTAKKAKEIEDWFIRFEQLRKEQY